jgi:hypothetical protein
MSKLVTDPLQHLRELSEARNDLALQFPRDQAALDAAESKFRAAILSMGAWPEQFGDDQPVMAKLVKSANSRNVTAVRMLLEPRVQVRLSQRGKQEPQMPAEDVIIQGVAVVVPRGVRVVVPESISDVLDSAGVS